LLAQKLKFGGFLSGTSYSYVSIFFNTRWPADEMLKSSNCDEERYNYPKQLVHVMMARRASIFMMSICMMLCVCMMVIAT